MFNNRWEAVAHHQEWVNTEGSVISKGGEVAQIVEHQANNLSMRVKIPSSLPNPLLRNLHLVVKHA